MKKLKLTKLTRKELKRVKGSDGEVITCVCGCGYVNCGGSSSTDNSSANVSLPDHGNHTCYVHCCHKK